jgi:soluble lytic murein transglycosylase-like protein
MLRSVACYLKFSALALVALAQPVSASWLMDVGSGQPSAPAVRTPLQGVAVPTPQASAYASLVAQYASANGVPASLVHRVIMRESRYNPRAANGGNYGIMQIRLGTARAMGYSGSAAGLLDAETNMTYAVKYLAGAYHAARGNEALAAALYARGYNAVPVQRATPASYAPVGATP